jgi:hypothetical protein
MTDRLVEQERVESEHWEWACPMWRIERDGWDSSHPYDTYELAPCDPNFPPSPLVGNWEVECENGHSVLNGSYGDESDAPYDPAYLKAIGARKVPGR